MIGQERADSGVEVTLVICTYDRRESLLETLATVAAQAAPNSWEVLVVDNNGSDGTAECVAERAASFPVPLRVIREEQQGRSFALNRAIDEARGEILIFTDDDVNLRSGFIAAHAGAYADPDVAGVGGRILPIMPANTPPWMLEMAEGRSGGLTGLYDYGDECRDIDPGRDMLLPFGANMSLRRGVIRALGGFRTDLGWGVTFVPGEESDVFQRLRETGARIVYQPGATVEHRFQESKATLAYYLKFEAGCGRALVLMSELSPVRRVRRIVREIWNLAVSSARAAFGSREMSIRLGHLRRSAQARGKLAQLLGL